MKTSITKLTLQGFKSFNRRISLPFTSAFNVICGPNGSGKTLSGKTEVFLSNGDILPISTLVENALKKSKNILKMDDGIYTVENPDDIKVWGLDKEKMKIVEKSIGAFVKRNGDPYLIKIRTRNGREIVSTGQHPVMVFKDNSITSVNVGDLRAGDLIATPKEIEIKNNQPVEIKIKTIESKKYPKKIEIPKFVTSEFARFLGYFIGDGNLTKQRCAFTNENITLLEDFIECGRKCFNSKPQIYRYKGELAYDVAFSSSVLSKFLMYLFRGNVKSHNKCIPAIILHSQDDIIRNLLASLFDCDGYVRKDVSTIEYATKSERLVKQIQFLLLRLGIVSKIKERLHRAKNSKEKKEKYYYLYISGIENLRRFYEKIPLLSQDKIKRLKFHINKKVKSQRNVEDILPKDVNKIVKQIINLLGLEIKKLKKLYPTLGAYVENRCYPTVDGIKNILPLFMSRMEEIEKFGNELQPEQNSLVEALYQLKITRQEASKSIGLHKDSITNSWIYRKFRSEPENLKKLYEFINLKIFERLKKSKELVGTLKKLISSDILWDKIVKIEKVAGEKWIYDLTIPNCHNFIANGIFVHNSNILDAICFVLGRTSAKSLRADRLHELIFHGGDGRKSAEIAAVTLYLDNSNKVFQEFEEPEISITRKVNRKGVTDYKLNGRTTTREKILQVLSSARIHPEGHNIVLQGDVTEIIEMSPIERRLIIDEISGIAEYNDKKDKAQRDMEAVDGKLKEAEIIITQRYDIYKKLEEERNTAIKYQNLQKQLTVLKASFLNKKIQTFTEQLEKINEKIIEKEEQNKRLTEEIGKIEDDLENKETAIRDVADKLIDLSKRVEIEKETSEIRSQLLIKKDRIETNLREIERLNNLLERLEALESKKAELAGEMPRAVQAILRLNLRGVHGVISNLISVPEKYQIAVEVAAGPHLYDIVTEDDDVASYCIEYLRRERIGRATFLPLNKIKPILFKETGLIGKHGVLGVASKLIKYDSKFMSAIEFVFGNTLVVETIDIAKAIGVGKVRMTTLDGDLIERSGAMIGGYYIKSHPKFVEAATKGEIERYTTLRKQLEEEVTVLKEDVVELEKKLKKYAVAEETKQLIDLEKLRIASERDVDELRDRRRKLQERKVNMEIELNRLNIEKAKIETELENLKPQLQSFGEIQYLDDKLHVLEEFMKKTEKELASIGLVNLRAIDEFEKFKTEFDEYKVKYERILEEKKAVVEMIEKIEEKRREVFYKCLTEISNEFNAIFVKMVGGAANLELENPQDLESGLIIKASPRGKTLLNIDAMSGGEKSLTALAFLFAIQKYKPAPFYILDEVDAALDKENSKIVAELIKKLSKDSQFIVITHNDTTIKYGDRVYGCSMVSGESKIMGLELPKA